MNGHLRVRSLMVVLSLALLLAAAYASGPGDVSAILIGDGSSATVNSASGISNTGSSWERAQDTPSGDVVVITPAPVGYDSGEMPNYLPPEEPKPVDVVNREVVIGSILNWQMIYSEPASVPSTPQEDVKAEKQAAPATGLLLGGSTTLWAAGIAALLIAIVALYWTGKNSQEYSEPDTPIEYPALTSTRHKKSSGSTAKKLTAKRKRR